MGKLFWRQSVITVYVSCNGCYFCRDWCKAFWCWYGSSLAETRKGLQAESTVTQVQPLDKLPADIAAAIEKLNQQNQLILLKRSD